MSHDLPLPDPVAVLYREHGGWLQGWLRKKIGNTVDAADLAHDTFERLLQRREVTHLLDAKGYLSTIARGLVIDLYRRRDLERAYLEALAGLPEAHHPSPETRLILLETLGAIDTMLSGLKFEVREAFLLSQLDGLTYQEIADRLGVTSRTVANHMAKAMGHCLAVLE